MPFFIFILIWGKIHEYTVPIITDDQEDGICSGFEVSCFNDIVIIIE